MKGRAWRPRFRPFTVLLLWAAVPAVPAQAQTRAIGACHGPESHRGGPPLEVGGWPAA